MPCYGILRTDSYMNHDMVYMMKQIIATKIMIPNDIGIHSFRSSTKASKSNQTPLAYFHPYFDKASNPSSILDHKG